MKLGFIVGKTNEEWNDPKLKKKTRKKHLADMYTMKGKLVKNKLHIDVAIAMTIREKFPQYEVDIILPKELSVERLKHNDINFVMGYDWITTIEQDPYIRKFTGKEGQQRLLDIYSDPRSKIFPPVNYMDFIWNKKRYLTRFQQKGIPINDTLFIRGNVTIPRLLAQIDSKGWSKFIIKPIGGCEGHGCSVFTTTEVVIEQSQLMDYFITQGKYYENFIVQQFISGFKKYGEIKSFWIDDTFRYAIQTIDETWGESIVTPMNDDKILSVCKPIAQKVLDALPTITFNGRKTRPIMTRIDLLCCLDNQPKSSMAYYINEIEEGQICGTYTNFPNITYPLVDVLADAFVRKAVELIK